MANIIDRLVTRLGYTKAQQSAQYPSWALEAADAARFDIPSGALYEQQASMYQRISWVYMAVKIVAQTAAAVELDVKREEGEELVDIPNHEFERLLRRPNPSESRSELLEALYSYRSLCGNAFWFLNRMRPDAPPDEIWTVRPDRLRVVPDGKSYIRGYLYDPGDGQEVPLEPWQIVHFKAFHPLHRFVGLSGIEPVAIDAMTDNKMAEWNARLFGQENARLPGIIAFADRINDTDWKRLQREASDSANKRRQMMLRGVGAGGVQWIQAAATLRDMEFIAGRQFTKEEIFGVFAPGLASMLAVNANEASGRVGYKTLIDLAVWPALTSTSEKITNDVLPAYGSDNLVAKPTDIRVTDRALELQEQSVYSRVHTINEIRQEFYNDDPLADERGDLLPAQIGAAATVIGDNNDATDLRPDNAPQAPGYQDRDMEPDDDMEAEVKAAAFRGETPSDHLRKWCRKAIKRGPGKATPFESDLLEPGQIGAILGALEATKSESDIRLVFDRALAWYGYP